MQIYKYKYTNAKIQKHKYTEHKHIFAMAFGWQWWPCTVVTLGPISQPFPGKQNLYESYHEDPLNLLQTTTIWELKSDNSNLRAQIRELKSGWISICPPHPQQLLEDPKKGWDGWNGNLWPPYCQPHSFLTLEIQMYKRYKYTGAKTQIQIDKCK